PAMALGMGNQIHVLFWTDHRQLWYTRQSLPIAGVTPQPTPTVAVPTTTVAPPTITPIPTQTPLPDYGPARAPPRARGPALIALGAGVVPVVLLPAVVMVFGRPFRR